MQEWCKVKNPNQPCTQHERKYPELSSVSFHPFLDNKNLKLKWFSFCKRNDVTHNNIAKNSTICSIHFAGGAGYTKMCPIPTLQSPESPFYLTSPN